MAAGAAAPSLVAFVIWLLEESERLGLRRLRFLSRDGQVLYELACRLAAATGSRLDLAYVYSSRLTWSLAATDPGSLAQTAWLYNSFIHSNAADVCSRRGLPAADFRQVMLDCGVSLDPDARADQLAQADALRRFAAAPEVVEAAGARISMMRCLVLDYSAQHQLADSGTGLVDIGWTGRMAGAFIELCEAAGMSRPAVLFWGHEPRANGWTDLDRVAAWMYNTATGHGLQWRVPNAPFVMETFCMADHGIVSGYRKDAYGTICPEVLSPRNNAAAAWGLGLYRSVLYAFTEALATYGPLPHGDPRPLVHQVLDAFWCNPTRDEALAWGSYPYDTDPAGTAARPLARPFTTTDHVRGDRAWLAGSLALSDPAARASYLRRAPESELVGAPETDLRSRSAERESDHLLVHASSLGVGTLADPADWRGLVLVPWRPRLVRCTRLRPGRQFQAGRDGGHRGKVIEASRLFAKEGADRCSDVDRDRDRGPPSRARMSPRNVKLTGLRREEDPARRPVPVGSGQGTWNGYPLLDPARRRGALRWVEAAGLPEDHGGVRRVVASQWRIPDCEYGVGRGRIDLLVRKLGSAPVGSQSSSAKPSD